jgi:hypothetical protein
MISMSNYINESKKHFLQTRNTNMWPTDKSNDKSRMNAWMTLSPEDNA